MVKDIWQPKYAIREIHLLRALRDLICVICEISDHAIRAILLLRDLSGSPSCAKSAINF